jgi:Fuc2NAc and GlcNAc transferase
MGDVGSGFLGFSLAAAAFLTAGHGPISLWTWLALNSLFFADATTTLLTRLFRGQRVYEAHRLHAYQRLARRWGSHGAVTLVYCTINLVWCLPWAVATIRSPSSGPVLAAAALLPLFLVAIIVGAGRPDT